MAGTKEIKRRIKSVKNTKKITKAMELVAASKMKHVVAKTLSSRLYAEYSWDLLISLSEKLDTISLKKGENIHPFFMENKSNKILIVLITSNRGLCGIYNTQILKKVFSKRKEMSEFTDKDDIDYIVIGKKGNNAIQRTKQNILASFTDLPDVISLSDVTPISELLKNEYGNKNYKKVYVAYTDFESTLSQKPKIRQILPISKEDLEKVIKELNPSNIEIKNDNLKKESEILHSKTPYIFEGDTSKLLESLAVKLIKMQIYQMLLESNASEQSLRMMSMKNAGDAAEEMIGDLTLVFNKARQANITREISEISAGMASVS